MDTWENPLSIEEIHCIQMCCQILKIGSDNKVAFIATTVVNEGGVVLPWPLQSLDNF